jgi:hypothetical protein
MQTLTQSVLSTQYVQALVRVTAPYAPYDPSRDRIWWAFTNARAFPALMPGTGDWNPGSWDVWPGPLYYAQVLVGPVNGGVVLSTGTWQSWLKISDLPEIPVLQPFLLQIV